MTKFTKPQMTRIAQQAHEAGMEAAQSAQVVPMVVRQHANPLDDGSAVVKEYFVADGVCGFASIRIKPGNSQFANFAKKELGARPAYYGGISINVSQFNQSMQLKEAYARAYAKVLEEHGINAWSESRMD